MVLRDPRREEGAVVPVVVVGVSALSDAVSGVPTRVLIPSWRIEGDEVSTTRRWLRSLSSLSSSSSSSSFSRSSRSSLTIIDSLGPPILTSEDEARRLEPADRSSMSSLLFWARPALSGTGTGAVEKPCSVFNFNSCWCCCGWIAGEDV